MIEISLVGPHALPGGDCSEAHRNYRGDGNGNVCILMRVILVSAVVLVHGIVDLRSVVCFTVCMFYFSKKKTPGVKTLKDSCRDCLVLWDSSVDPTLGSETVLTWAGASAPGIVSLCRLCKSCLGRSRSQSLWQESGLGLCRRIRCWKGRGSVLNTLLTRDTGKRLLLLRCYWLETFQYSLT